MRVDFRADVDLAKLAYKKNSTVLAISLFCGTDNPDLSIGPPTVYLQGHPLLQGKWGQATQSEASSSPGSREYHFFLTLRVARTSSLSLRREDMICGAILRTSAST